MFKKDHNKLIKNVYKIIHDRQLKIKDTFRMAFENHIEELLKRIKENKDLSIEIPNTCVNEVEKKYIEISTLILKLFKFDQNNKINKEVEIFLIASYLQISNAS